MTAVEWVPGMTARIVEHNDLTREPRQDGEVMSAQILKAEGLYVRARVLDGSHAGEAATFWASSGWTAWDGSFRWRLLPVGREAATPAGTEKQ